MDRRVEVVMHLMQIQIEEPFPLSELAQAVNLSSSRLRHLFKAETGLSVKRYRKAQRLRVARALLAETFLTVKEIAGRVGANDLSRFVRDFKADCGQTPTQYRKAHTRDPVA